MLTVLLRSRKDLSTALDEAVAALPRPLVIAQEHELSLRGAFERRMPWRPLIEQKARLHILVIADDGFDGVWRDPMGELAERLFPNDPDRARTAAGGYLLLFRDPEEPPDALRRDLWDPWVDVAALATRLRLAVRLPRPEPEPPKRPRTRAPVERHDTPVESMPFGAGEAEAAPATPQSDAPDPLVVLGLPPGTPFSEAKATFRSLIMKFHPDRLGALSGPERDEAERRSRELTVAYDTLRKQQEEKSHA